MTQNRHCSSTYKIKMNIVFFVSTLCCWSMTSSSSSSFIYHLPLVAVVTAFAHPTFTSHRKRCAFDLYIRGGGGDGDDNDSVHTNTALKSTTEQQSTTQTTTSTTTSTTTTSKIIAQEQTFLKSLPDKRTYRSILLQPSNLQVLLISSPTTDVEAASVHVKSGHFDDPPHRAGLAHFHEHMLFLGTNKYPREEEYEGFLSKNGGSSNAYTDMEDTNYYFNVAPLDHSADDDDNYQDDDNDDGELELQDSEEKVSAALSGALDRFAQFFISPLFHSNMVQRELKAIDSEYKNALSSDVWRNYMLLKSSANQQHPFAKFGCGNYDTLTNFQGGDGDGNDDDGGAREDLIQFWEEKYTGENMKLCVLGRANLDELQKVVEDTFGPVRPSSSSIPLTPTSPQQPPPAVNGETKNKCFPTENTKYNSIPAFPPHKLSKIQEIIPVTEHRTLKLFFATPPLDDASIKKSKPYRVISHLLGHESVGSLHYLLAEELGLINDLTSGVGIDTSDFSLSSITLSLTPKGLQQRDYILSLVFQWIRLIKSAVSSSSHDSSLMSSYHDELRCISEMNFRFREMGDPTDFVSTLSELMFEFEPKDILSGNAITGEYDADVAKAYLDRFTPENVLITIHNPDADSTEEEYDDGDEYVDTNMKEAEWNTEKYYGAKYRQIDISPETLEKWNNEAIDERLKLPDLNQFIPTDFSLRCDDENEQEQHDDAENTTGKEEAVDDETSITPTPPKLLIETPGLRLWHKLDKTFRVPKTYIRAHISSPNIYRSPRTMTYNRLYQKVLADDLNSFVYDASVAGCTYRVTCAPSGFRIALSGYSEKLTDLLDVVTSRMQSLLEEMKAGPEAHPELAQKFKKAHDNLLRETKNYRLDSPYETASYNSRMLMEDNVWHIDNYINEMEGEGAESDPLTMMECAGVVEESLFGRVKAEALCMGNINASSAQKVGEVIKNHFLKESIPLSEDEIPKFRSLMMPTKSEAVQIFGSEVASLKTPVVVEDIANSENEENNAVELILQAGCEHELGYEGISVLELIGHIAYNSAYQKLRTEEQLGYIVSAFPRRISGGGHALSVVVQSSSTLPATLEERCEAWLETFHKELVDMPEERVAMEAAAVVAQLLERDTNLADQVSSAWGEILLTESVHSSKLKQPAFDRLERLAQVLMVKDIEDDDYSVDDSEGDLISPKLSAYKTASELKAQMLKFFDKYFVASSSERRAISARVYNQKGKSIYEGNMGKPGVLSSYSDSRHLKQYLSSWPTAPYWIRK